MFSYDHESDDCKLYYIVYDVAKTTYDEDTTLYLRDCSNSGTNMLLWFAILILCEIMHFIKHKRPGSVFIKKIK